MARQTVQYDDIIMMYIACNNKVAQKLLCNREILVLQKLVGLKKPFYCCLFFWCQNVGIILHCIPQLLAEIKVIVCVPPQLLGLHLIAERGLSCSCGS